MKLNQPTYFNTSTLGTQSYNRYAYCLNNPFKYTDPSGFTSYYVDGVQVSFQDYRMMGGAKFTSRAYGNSSYLFDFGISKDKNTTHLSVAYQTAFNTLENIDIEGKGETTEYNVTNIQWNRMELLFTNSIPDRENESNNPNYSGGTSCRSGNPAKTVSNINNYVGIVMSGAEQTVQNTRVGANFAYTLSGNIKVLNTVVNTFKSAPYVGLALTAGTGYYLSTHVDPATGKPYQSWAETGTDIGANIGTIYLGTQYGGWIGAVAATLYIADKAAFKWYMKARLEHPEYWQGIPHNTR